MDARAAPLRPARHAQAPFRLIAGAGPSNVDRAAAALAAQHSAFAIELECAPLRGFLAWRLTESDPAGRARIHALANAAVRELDPLRAPPTPEELAKRLRHPLAPAQHALLERWGYPYVFDQFTFHITLSEKLADAELRQAQACIARYADPLAGRPMPVDGVSVYVQPGPGEDFLAARHYRFDGGREDVAGAAYMQERRRHERRAPDLPDGRVRQRQGHLAASAARAVACRRTRHRRASLHHARQRRQRGRAAALGR